MSILDSLTSGLGQLANPFGVPSKGQWNLSKGLYTSSTGQQLVLYYEMRGSSPPKGNVAPSDKVGETLVNQTGLDQITDSGGARLVTFEYPYVDGQRLKRLGRKGESYTFNLKFFGLAYQKKFQDFKNIVGRDPGTGSLLHPVLSTIQGAIPVQLDTFEVIHRHDEWNAVTIRATFKEDNTNEISSLNLPQASPDSALRSGLQALVDAQTLVSQGLSDATALLLLPGSIKAAFQARLTTIVNQTSQLLGQLAATFSSNASLQSLASQAKTVATSMPQLNAGTITTVVGGSTVTSKLPPVFQVGFDTASQASIVAQIQSFVNSNTVTPAQAVFATNQIRKLVSAEIASAESTFGNAGYAVMLQYRGLAVALQTAVESALASTQTLVKVYTVPVNMSMRKIAQNNGLTPDRQNDIAALNPDLSSINYVLKGSQVLVPAA